MRFSEKDRIDVLGSVIGARPFEPREGMIMREYVSLPKTLLDDKSSLIRLLGRSYAYASSLPPKEVRKKKKK